MLESKNVVLVICTNKVRGEKGVPAGDGLEHLLS